MKNHKQYYFLDDKKLSGVLKKMQLQPLNGIEEVNIFLNDGNVVQIKTPKSKFNHKYFFFLNVFTHRNTIIFYLQFKHHCHLILM